MKIRPVKRSASLAERHSLSLNIFPDDGLVTPGDASLRASLRALVSTPALSFPSIFGSRLNRS